MKDGFVRFGVGVGARTNLEYVLASNLKMVFSLYEVKVCGRAGEKTRTF